MNSDKMLTKQRILIVDDVPMNIQLLAETLRMEYQVLIAASAKRALEIAMSDKPPDLILLDILMPDMDGYELCFQLKNDSQTKNIPIIFITSKNQTYDEEKGLKLGAVDYITKPFYIPIVKSRIDTHLNLKLKTDLLEKLAMIDGLTNLYNRRYFDIKLKETWKGAKRDKSEFVLLLIDVDYFKNYNDMYGHLLGDDALKYISRIIENSLMRPYDTSARYGGEEFTVILPDTDIKGGYEVAERILNSIRLSKIEHNASCISSYLTVSIGMTIFTYKMKYPSEKEILQAADQSLYIAKENGRNRIYCHSVDHI